MRTWFTTPLFLCVLACATGQRLAADEPAAQKTTDTFFAGTVRDSSAEMVTVGRTVRGRAESRTFRLTPDTKIEGTLESKARVTVRYVTDDDGDTATLIVVHALARPAPSKSKKP